MCLEGLAALDSDDEVRTMNTLRVGHSPDPDDAFMFYGIAKGKVGISGYEVQHVVEDIESLNKRALKGELEVTAISAAVYPQVAQHYRILACGASVGRNYGPILLARQSMTLADLKGKRVGVPGEFTTAYLLLRIYAFGFTPVFQPFDQIMGEVSKGAVDAGLIIHEGQITHPTSGLVKVADLGQVWFKDTGLPIPLGLDVVHRRLGDEMGQRVFDLLSGSIDAAMKHEREAVVYSQEYGRGLDFESCKRFVRMYVNDDTVQMGQEGKRALEVLFAKARQKGLTASVPPLDIVGLA